MRLKSERGEEREMRKIDWGKRERTKWVERERERGEQ